MTFEEFRKFYEESGLTYKEIGEAIGYDETTIKGITRFKKISAPMGRAIEMYQELVKLRARTKDLESYENGEVYEELKMLREKVKRFGDKIKAMKKKR